MLDREEPEIFAIYEELLKATSEARTIRRHPQRHRPYAARMIGMGFRFVTLANDSGLMARAARAEIAITRKMQARSQTPDRTCEQNMQNSAQDAASAAASQSMIVELQADRGDHRRPGARPRPWQTGGRISAAVSSRLKAARRRVRPQRLVWPMHSPRVRLGDLLANMTAFPISMNSVTTVLHQQAGQTFLQQWSDVGTPADRSDGRHHRTRRNWPWRSGTCRSCPFTAGAAAGICPLMASAIAGPAPDGRRARHRAYWPAP